MSINIAIDGPAGAGKSTIAKKIAEKLNFVYVDTGAMYRAMALFMIEHNIKPEESDKISEYCKKANISIRYEQGEQIVLLNDKNVNGYIRSEEVGKMASVTSAHPEVRLKLLDLQRELAKSTNVIMDGRDIGTHILPNADVKIFLTASSSIRAKRRADELMAKGIECNVKQIEKDIMERDNRDMSRETAPLIQAKDATLIDTSDMTIEEAVDAISALCQVE